MFTREIIKKAAVLLFLFFTSFILNGCATPKPLPAKETIIKLSLDDNKGIIAESATTTYLFTSERSQKELQKYRQFIAAFEGDITAISVEFKQYGNEITARYHNIIPYLRIDEDEHKKAQLQPFKSRSYFDIYNKGKDDQKTVEVIFTTVGTFKHQPNMLSTAYLLEKPIEIPIKQPTPYQNKSNSVDEFLAPLAIPFFIPFMMVGCMIGPC